MHRISWRRKGKKGNKIREATKPGQCVSVDQMEPITPGLVAQLKSIDLPLSSTIVKLSLWFIIRN